LRLCLSLSACTVYLRLGICGLSVLLALRIANAAMTIPCQDFGVGRDGHDVAFEWPASKLLLELVGGPSGLVTALKRDMRQHGVELSLLAEAIDMRVRSARAVEVSEIAFAHVVIETSALGHEAAMVAGPPTGTDCLALRAFQQARRWA